MKSLIAPLIIVMLVGCDPPQKNMNIPPHSSDWTAGDPVPDSQTYSDPPKSIDPSRIQFYGLKDDDSGHRLYSIPANTPIADVARAFEVGSHSAISNGGDAAETVALVATKASRIAEIIPCHVVFADAAGLKLRFERQVTDDDLKKIEGLFPEDIMMQAGLERYLSEWDGEGSMLEPIKHENLFHFWWD